ncbi:MAG: hypothetical protein GEU82_05105 [Luteitalea sp.]|nr:hypothetical protein [Luteitalea sp.]
MKHRLIAASLGAFGVVMIVVSLSSSTIAGQAPAADAAAKAPAAPAYVVPRTPDGHPDLQGVWANNDATPLERPKELEGRKFLTEAEVAVLKRRAGELFNGETDAAFGDSVYLAVLKEAKDFKSTDTQTGNYNHFWIVEREFDNRTALITDPPDGRVPELTPQAKERQAAAAEYRKLHPADGPEDLPLSHRCVTFGVPRLGAGYNSYFQIFQSRNQVAIGQEMIHDVRLVPLDGRPHLSPAVRQWHGDPRGRWEGDTLVVETTNFSDKSRFQGLSSENLKVVERYTRIGPKTIQWDVTVNDPSTWTKPWTATLLLRSTPDPIFEMACHEGNEGLSGALSGHRALEKAPAKSSR